MVGAQGTDALYQREAMVYISLVAFCKFMVMSDPQ